MAAQVLKTLLLLDVVAGTCGDGIRPPVTPADAETLAPVASYDTGDPAKRGTSLSP